MRVLIAFLLVFVPFASLSATESPLVVIRLTSVHAALDDLEALGMFDDPHEERERFLYEMVEPLRLPLGAWLDRNRPVFLSATQAGIMGDHDTIVALLPVLDVDDALRALGGDPASEPDDGIHELDPADDLRWYVVGEDDYLTIGLTRDEVAGFERDVLEVLEFPPGSMGLQIDLEVVAPMLQGLISTQRETMTQQFVEMSEQQVSAAEQGQAPEQPVADPEALVGMLDFYFDTGLMILSNTASIQLSLSGSADGAVVRTRVVPTKDSVLEALLAAQPVGFGKLGRAVPEGPALVSYSGNIRLTSDVREGLSQFIDTYTVALEGMSGMMPELSGFTEMLDDQMEMAKKQFACIAGEVAGVWDMSKEEGMRSIQLSRNLTTGDCATLTDQQVEAMAGLLGPDGEPLVTVSEPNVVPGDVRAMRVEVDMERLLGGDEATTELMRGMFGSSSPVTYFGQADDITVSVSGPDAEKTFTEVVDRLQSRRKRGGLTPELFAPLEAGAGLFAVVDLSRFDLSAFIGAAALKTDSEEEAETDSEDEEGLAGRLVIGAHAERGRLAIDVALAAEVIRSWFEDDAGKGVPSNLWPPPHAPVNVEEETTEAAPEGAEAEDIRVAGEGGVTPPVNVHKIEPDYPEALRQAGLEGSVILQAVVTREGTVQDLQLLSCSGKHPGESQPRKNLLHESTFCTMMSDAAMAAVERWRYEPARDGDEPVDVNFTVFIDFKLH